MFTLLAAFTPDVLKADLGDIGGKTWKDNLPIYDIIDEYRAKEGQDDYQDVAKAVGERLQKHIPNWKFLSEDQRQVYDTLAIKFINLNQNNSIDGDEFFEAVFNNYLKNLYEIADEDGIWIGAALTDRVSEKTEPRREQKHPGKGRALDERELPSELPPTHQAPLENMHTQPTSEDGQTGKVIPYRAELKPRRKKNSHPYAKDELPYTQEHWDHDPSSEKEQIIMRDLGKGTITKEDPMTTVITSQRQDDAIVYNAVLLDEDSKAALKSSYPGEHPNYFGEHITLNFGKKEYPANLGEAVVIDLVGYAKDESGEAVEVLLRGAESDNDNPHITISTAEGIEAVYSNKLLAQGIERMDFPLTLTGTVASYVRDKGWVTKLDRREDLA